MRRMCLMLAASFALVAAFAAAMTWLADDSEAAIHEIVASHCSAPKDGGPADKGEGHAGETDPPGLLSDIAFIRPLFATGVITELVFGEDPDGNPGPFLTIVVADQPALKFSWDGETYVSQFDPELGLTIFFPAIEPDHPGLLNCNNLQPLQVKRSTGSTSHARCLRSDVRW